MAACPCGNLKRGAADLAIAASMAAQPQIFFGGAFVPVVTAALHGTATLTTAAVLIVWVAILGGGIFQSLEGFRAAAWHSDPFNAAQFAWSLGAGLLCLYVLYGGWSPPREWGALIAACSRCALLAGVAYNAAGLWLGIRGPVALLFVRNEPPRHEPPPQFYEWGQPPQDSGAAAELVKYREVMDGLAQEVEQKQHALVTWEQAVAERDRIIAEQARIIAEQGRTINAVVAERDHSAARGDRFQTKGKVLLAEVGQFRSHAEAIRKVPGGWKAVSKAVHPDTGPPGERAARTEIFKLVKHIFEGRNDAR